MLKVTDQFYVSFFIGSSEIPLYPGSFSKILVLQNIKFQVPIFQIDLSDPSNLLTEDVDISDGSKLSIIMGRSPDDPEQQLELSFRCFGQPQIIYDGNKLSYVITGYQDCAKYWRSIADTPIKGTSSQAIQKIGQNCNLQTVTDETNDQQRWLPTGSQSNCQFAHDIANHGWVDNKSIMSLGVDELGVLHYKNLTELITKQPSQIWSVGKPTTDTGARSVFAFTMKTKSGVLNHFIGYGAKTVQEQLSGDTANVINKFDTTLMANYLNIGGEVKGEVHTVRNTYAAPHSGNTHSNYKQGEYQCSRGRATFSTHAYPVFLSPQGAQLFNVVDLTVELPNLDQGAMYSGNYLVSAKTRMITGNQYYEKYEISSTGLGLSPSGDLLGAIGDLGTTVDGLLG